MHTMFVEETQELSFFCFLKNEKKIIYITCITKYSKKTNIAEFEGIYLHWQWQAYFLDQLKYEANPWVALRLQVLDLCHKSCVL